MTTHYHVSDFYTPILGGEHAVGFSDSNSGDEIKILQPCKFHSTRLLKFEDT